VWTTYSNTNTVPGLAFDGDHVWVGTSGGVLLVDPSDQTYVKYTPSNSGLADNYVFATAVGSARNKWFGTYVGTYVGVTKLDGSTWTTYNTANSGLANNLVDAIAIDSAGNKWFGTGDGVSKFDGSTWTTYTTDNGLAQVRLPNLPHPSL
jgi:ligand-binding sensor domain-containing protein